MFNVEIKLLQHHFFGGDTKINKKKKSQPNEFVKVKDNNSINIFFAPKDFKTKSKKAIETLVKKIVR